MTRGEIYVGYGSLLGGDVRFVITDRGEEAPSTVITWLVVHTVAGAVAGALVAVAWRLVRNRAESEAVRPQGALAEPGGRSSPP